MHIQYTHTHTHTHTHTTFTSSYMSSPHCVTSHLANEFCFIYRSRFGGAPRTWICFSFTGITNGHISSSLLIMALHFVFLKFFFLLWLGWKEDLCTSHVTSHYVILDKWLIWMPDNSDEPCVMCGAFNLCSEWIFPPPKKQTPREKSVQRLSSLHLCLNVSLCCLSGRRTCRSTMWRQACSTRGTTWAARCRTATATCWPASPWRSLTVRLLRKPSGCRPAVRLMCF